MAKSASIAKISHKHEDIMNFMLANPTMKMGEIAAHFQVSFPWLSTIVHSEAFQDRLRRKQDEIFNVAVVQEIGGKLEAATQVTLDAYLEKVPQLSADQLISAGDKFLGRLGYGSRHNGGNGAATTQVNVTVNQVEQSVLEEARNRIGSHKVGAADSQAALPDKSSEEGIEIEGVAIRAESAPRVNGEIRDHELHTESVVQVPADRKPD